MKHNFNQALFLLITFFAVIVLFVYAINLASAQTSSTVGTKGNKVVSLTTRRVGNTENTAGTIGNKVVNITTRRVGNVETTFGTVGEKVVSTTTRVPKTQKKD